MNRIYFVRHGEGQDNVARKFSSTWTDHSLTERGRLQALQTGQSLAGRHIDGVFCSPMKRTHETAQIIAEQLDVEPVVLKELGEVNVGVLEGKDWLSRFLRQKDPASAISGKSHPRHRRCKPASRAGLARERGRNSQVQ